MKLKALSHSLDPSKRADILSAAIKVFSEVGFREATVRQICKEARANICLISYYFGGKDCLYQAVFDQAGRARLSMAQSLLGDQQSITTSQEYKIRLELFLKTTFNEILANPDFFKLLHREMSERMPRAEETIKQYFGGMRVLFTE